VQVIAENMFNKRSKVTIKKKIIELGLSTKEALACKKGKRKSGIEIIIEIKLVFC